MAPILAAVAAFAFSTGGFGPAVLAFVLFALTMALLMLLTSVLAAMSHGFLLRRLRASARGLQQTANAVLLAVGVATIYFSIDVDAARSLFIR